ncbi:hypothetical protein CSHISOI_07710 [Colletotrichum shisoi]|uniref:F-box domain-containing protein n=1 Tax=Colletotrichum shisoi TaxID=2078593 RepID=A0A5Q4BLS0_9PEZI|nr:hypothetical protein CSHISOI_07710 [Colletotrichum shisoi]
MGNRSSSSAKRRARAAPKKPVKPQLPVVKMEPRTFSSLPNEIIVLIAKESIAEGGHRQLRSFCQTNRRNFELSQRELYRYMIIHHELQLLFLARSLIENPSLRGMIRTFIARANQWHGRQRDSDPSIRDWHNISVDESKLSLLDRQLLILSRAHSTQKSVDNIQCIFGLLLFFINQVEHVIIEVDYYWPVLDSFLAAGLASYTPLPANGSMNVNLYSTLLPSLKTLYLATKFYLRKELRSIQARPFHPFNALTASTNLRVFVFDGDMDKWSDLDDIESPMKLTFTTVKLTASHCTASSLCKFLRHCPDLRRLEVAPQGYAADYGIEENINVVLPKYCPQLRELSLRLGGASRHFFRSEQRTLSCLPQLVNLKELRIEVTSFLIHHTHLSTLILPNKLPEQLEKLFLDASMALAPFPALGGRMTARSPEARTYKRAIDGMIQDLCRAREDQLLQLNTIVVGAKYVKPVLWTKNANKTLAGTGARLKVTSGVEIHKLWDSSWDAMKI